MKSIFRTILAILLVAFQTSCAKDNFPFDFDNDNKGEPIEINGVKYPIHIGFITFSSGWSGEHGAVMVPVDQNDEEYDDLYETIYYRFYFDKDVPPSEGDNLAKMNLKLEYDLSYEYNFFYDSGDLIVKSVFDYKKDKIKVQFKDLRMSNRRKTKQYVFNGTVTVPFDYRSGPYIEDY